VHPEARAMLPFRKKYDPFLKLGNSNCLTTKNIEVLGIVLSMYHVFPKLPIIQIVYFDLGSKEAQINIGKIMDNHPTKLLLTDDFQLARCNFRWPSKSFQRQFTIWELIKSRTNLGNLKNERR
jgi:hypothetical protein